jgi:hypothetical protein
MAKIGTAVLEIKPVLNEAALQEIATLIEEAVAAGIARGLAKQNTYRIYVGDTFSPGTGQTWPYGQVTSGQTGTATTVTWTSDSPSMTKEASDALRDHLQGDNRL